jgi:RPEL repeat
LPSSTTTQFETSSIFLWAIMSSTETTSEQSVRAALEKKLAQRPDKQELINYNILPGTRPLTRILSGGWQHDD